MVILKDIFEDLKKRFGENYIALQGWKDKKFGVQENFFKASTTTYEEFEKTAKEINVNKELAVGFCVNPLKENSRSIENISKIKNIFIDLDGGRVREEYEKLKSILHKYNITFWYTDESGNGYHFLIPVNLETEEKDRIKNFFIWLRNETKLKSIDQRVKDITRIARLPFSIHRKNEQPFICNVLEYNNINNEHVLRNTNFLMGDRFKEADKEVEEQIKIQDDNTNYFFNKIINDKEIRDQLAKTKEVNKNNIFFKNMAIFYCQNNTQENYDKIKEFVELSGHHIKEFDGWVDQFDKGSINKINYLEIKKIIYEKEDLHFLKDLINEQIVLYENFLNNYDFCYLKSANSENRFLLYNKHTGSHTVNSEKQMYRTILYEANQMDFNFVEYYYVSTTNEKGKDLSITQIENIIIDNIKSDILNYKLMKTIYDFGYKPTTERYFTMGGEQYFNTFKPGMYDDWNEEKKEYKFDSVKQYLMHLVGDGGVEGYQWFIKWLAWQMQNPTEKITTSVIFKGTQGTGKGRLREWLLPYLFGEHNMILIDDTNLNNVWGDFIVDTRFVCVNEIKLVGQNASKVIKKIKQYSTDVNFSVQIKNQNVRKITNYSHWVFFSDQDMPFKIEAADRRHAVFTQNKPINQKLVDNINIRSNPNYVDEVKDFISYLKNLKVKHSEVDKPIMTDSKQELINLSRESIEVFMEEMCEYRNYKEFCAQYGCFLNQGIPDDIQNDFVLSRDLYSTYKQWCDVNMYKYHANQTAFSMKLSQKYGIQSELNENVFAKKWKCIGLPLLYSKYSNFSIRNQ